MWHLIWLLLGISLGVGLANMLMAFLDKYFPLDKGDEG